MKVTIDFPNDQIIVKAVKYLPEGYPLEKLEIELQEAQDSLTEIAQQVADNMEFITDFMGKMVATTVIHGKDSYEVLHVMDEYMPPHWREMFGG